MNAAKSNGDGMNTLTLARKTARRLFRESRIDGRIDDQRARQAVMSLIESRRRNTLRVLTEFRRLIRLDRDRHTAVVESARPIPADLRARIVADLTQRYGRGLHVSFNYDPRLIGGLRVKVGSDIFDGTVRGRLAALKERF
jgi:F-type H+-transporting ATPase subunit delta